MRDPPQRLVQSVLPDLARDDLGEILQGCLDVVRVIVPAMSPQELGQGRTMRHRQGGDARVVSLILFH